MAKTILYDYRRSTASYRVRIALNLAEITYKSISVDLLAKEQTSRAHLSRNPQGFVPVLEIDNTTFTQSMTMVEYLNETRSLDLLPASPAARAKVRALAQSIAMDIHPVCNLSVVSYAESLAAGKTGVKEQWMKYFIEKGLKAYETMLGGFTQSPYSAGDRPTLADLCLIPQIYNAERWQVDYTDCKQICGVIKACENNPAFRKAHPDNLKPTNI